MSNLATTRLSSKGQVVIPEEIRKRLGLRCGTEFVVVADRDVVILRTISPPSMEEFDDMIATARRTARRAGVKKSHVKAAIAKVRSHRALQRGGK